MHLAIITVLANLLAVNLWAAPEVLWKHDFGAAKLGPLFAGGDIADDTLAAGGKSLQLAFAKAGALPAIFSAKDIPLAGTGVIRVRVRGKDLNDVANGLRLTVTLHNQTTGRRYLADGMVYAVRANEKAYRVLPIYFEVGDTPAPYTLTILPTWQAQTGDRKPSVWIAGIELEGHGKNAPYISGLLRSRTNYAPGAQVKIAVTVVNPTQDAFEGKLQADDLVGLEGRRKVANVSASLAPGERRVYDLAWKAAGAESGHEVEFSLQNKDGKLVARDSMDVGITNDGRLLAFPAHDFEQSWRPSGGGLLYVYPASHTQSKKAVEMGVRDRDNHNGRMEFFGWSWCDLAGFIPPEDPYVAANGQWWLSLKEYKEQIAMVKDSGVHVESYILGCATDEAGYELYQKHPDWFMYGRDGEIGSYNMEAHARYSRRHEFEFAPVKDGTLWASLDPTHPGVRSHISNQCIRLGKEMGFNGARWDIWMMNVAPGQYRLDGSEIAPTWEEADRLSAESLKAVKDAVAKELPDFTWGYNYGAPEENKNTPLFLAEKCRGHAWILDEVAITYGAKTSPFHFWNAYSKRFIEWGDRIRQLDGIYDPWIFDRGFNAGNPNHVEVDWLHATIFRILAGGRVWIPLYKNNSALAGDLPRMAFRFSDTFSGWNLRLQPEDQKRVVVDAPPTLWWKGYVFTNKSPEGKEQAIVHLVNSPVSEEVSGNRDSKVRPPVLNVTVRCNAVGGRLPQKAWLVMAEPLTPEAEPAVQAVPLKLTKQGSAVRVTVPSVLYLKTVVFEY